MLLTNFIDHLRTKSYGNTFIIILRVVLGLAFIYPTIPKITGSPFTILDRDSPAGYFFDCLTRLSLYWKFLGWSQLICGILLLTQRFALIGAIIFMAFITNIFFYYCFAKHERHSNCNVFDVICWMQFTPLGL